MLHFNLKLVCKNWLILGWLWIGGTSSRNLHDRPAVVASNGDGDTPLQKKWKWNDNNIIMKNIIFNNNCTILISLQFHITAVKANHG